MDCGTALTSDDMEAVLRESRALFVVTSASIDSVTKTRTTLDWLRHNGYHKLVDSTVLVINHIERKRPGAVLAGELEQLSGQFAAGRVVVLPFDPHVHAGRGISLERLSKLSRRRYLELAAVLAEMFPRRALVTRGHS
jgi:MinD-like ATPase involved in chromosome partitioning or flagellar assembly